MDLSPLAELPQPAQCVLFKSLQETMRDRTALSYLQCVVSDTMAGPQQQYAMFVVAASLFVDVILPKPLFVSS